MAYATTTNNMAASPATAAPPTTAPAQDPATVATMSTSTVSPSPATIPMFQRTSKPRSSERIRSNLLHKLGIENAMETESAEQVAAKVPPRSLLGEAVIHHEPLKSSNEEEEKPVASSWFGSGNASSSGSSPTSVAPKTTSKRLVFHDEVTVVPIPMRDEYSDRVRERLWNNAHEILYNAHRNSVEFAAEGWDWRNVTEEEGMYECSLTGEKIHPVHVDVEQMEE